MSEARLFLIALASILLQHCTPARYVKPLQKKQQALALSFGGPLIQFAGAPVPLPFTTLGYAYGASDKITAYGNLHTTSLLFGNLQADLGATFRLFERERRFGISAAPALQIASTPGKNGTRAWPTLEANTYFHPGSKASYLYAGFNSWFELSGSRAHHESQARHVIPNLQCGYTIVKERWQHQFQLSYLGLGIPNLPGIVSYIGIGHRGSFGVYYSLIRLF